MSDSDENITNNNDQINPWHSKPLDVHRWSDHPEINKLVDELWVTFVGPALVSGSNNRGKSDPKKQLKVLLLDLYVAWLEDPTLCVGIQYDNNAYRVGSRYNALHISRKLRDVSKLLIEAGYLDYARWSHPRQIQGSPARTSRVRPSRSLQDQFNQLTISDYDIDHHHREETVILTDYETDEEGNYTKSNGRKKRLLIEYKDTPDTNQIRRDLASKNYMSLEPRKMKRHNVSRSTSPRSL